MILEGHLGRIHMMKEAEPDILRKIHEAERQADRIIRKAEGEARFIRTEAHKKRDEIIRVREMEMALHYKELLENELRSIEAEMKLLHREAQEQAGHLCRRAKEEIDSIVDQMLEMVLRT